MATLKESTSLQEAAVLQFLRTVAPLRGGAPLTGLPAAVSRGATCMLVGAGCLEFVLGIATAVLAQSGAIKTLSPSAQFGVVGFLALTVVLAIGAMVLQRFEYAQDVLRMAIGRKESRPCRD